MQTGTFLALRRFYKILRMPKKAEKNSGKKFRYNNKIPQPYKKRAGQKPRRLYRLAKI